MEHVWNGATKNHQAWLRIWQTPQTAPEQTTVRLSSAESARPSTQLSGWAGVGWGLPGSQGRPEPVWKLLSHCLHRRRGQRQARRWHVLPQRVGLRATRISATVLGIIRVTERAWNKTSRETKGGRKIVNKNQQTLPNLEIIFTEEVSPVLSYVNIVRVYFMYNWGKQDSTKITARLSISVFWYYTQVQVWQNCL